MANQAIRGLSEQARAPSKQQAGITWDPWGSQGNGPECARDLIGQIGVHHTLRPRCVLNLRAAARRERASAAGRLNDAAGAASDKWWRRMVLQLVRAHR